MMYLLMVPGQLYPPQRTVEPLGSSGHWPLVAAGDSHRGQASSCSHRPPSCHEEAGRFCRTKGPRDSLNISVWLHKNS